MRYSNKLIILLTLSTIALILVGESHKTIPSKEEKEEMKKLLTYLNKPAVKSFQVNLAFLFLNFHKTLQKLLTIVTILQLSSSYIYFQTTPIFSCF